MALPKNNVSYGDYFTDALRFLNDHDYIFNFANTDILVNDVLKRFSVKWRKHLDSVEINENLNLSENEKNAAPSSCHISNQYDIFKASLQRLQPSMNCFKHDNSDLSVKQKPLNGLSPKKQHEIFKLSELIHNHCKHKNINLIVDIGSGLGYLSQLMHEKYGYSVLGIESEEIRLASAVKRQEKYHKSSVKNVKYVRHFVTAQSENTLMELVKENFDKCDRFCLVGLHACADLAVNAIKLFLQIKECKSLIMMPCCYHKMTFTSEIKLNNTNKDSSVVNVQSLDNQFDEDRFKLVDTTNKISITNNARQLLNIDTHQVEENIVKTSTDAMDYNGFIFENFPLSKALKTSGRKLNADILLRRPFLRLACQRVQAGWNDTGREEKDGARVFHLMSRAILQLYAQKENAKLVKIKRRAVRKIQSKKCDFESFLDDAINRGYVLEKISDANNIFADMTVFDKHLCKSTSEVSENFSNSTTGEMHSENCEKNNATGNCSDSIATNKNVVSQCGIEKKQLQKKERSKTIQREYISYEEGNEACQIFESTEVQKNANYVDFDKCELLTLWSGLGGVDFDAAALLLDLQDSLQGLCENIVLLDKIAYLHERNEGNGGVRFEFLKVTNDSLSPRCHALVAEK